ncbi:MAG TPA: hypothetical protein VFE51_07405 [Verrucomicrobiae bacterium]|nr:hypothetical protein [Verrucomicrobiae bacterium]
MPSPITNSANASRFTLDGSPGLESRLAALCEQIREAVLRLIGDGKVEALVLGGGYGRGHGGVLKTPVGDAPYNDLEFYVFLKGNPVLNETRYRKRLGELGDSLSPAAGLHVEFKVDSLLRFRKSPVSIFSYDLVSGHRVIQGSDKIFAGCEHHRDAARIVPTEATRLLLNRCSGLLLVKELLLKSRLTDEECDFIGRNLAKAKLALGDALLAVEGRYHWDCRHRGRRLAELSQDRDWPFGRQILAHHGAGVQFKLHPRQLLKPRVEFAAEHFELTKLALQVWLWVENRRLRTNFATLEEYALSSIKKCSGQSLWRNLLLNLRTFGAGATFDRNTRRYPRERLFNALPLLLAQSPAQAVLEIRRHLQRQLNTRAEDWLGLVAAYKRVWRCYG